MSQPNVVEAERKVRAVNEALKFVEAAKVEEDGKSRFEFLTEKNEIFFTSNEEIAKEIMSGPNFHWTVTCDYDGKESEIVNVRPSGLKTVEPTEHQNFDLVLGLRRVSSSVNNGNFAGLWELSELDPKDHRIVRVITDANLKSQCSIFAQRALARTGRNAGK